MASSTPYYFTFLYHSIIILICQFLVLGSSDFEDAFKAAVLMNVYNKRAAAAAHLCQAWSQLVDISVLGCGGVLVQGGSMISFTLRHVFNIVSDYYNTTFHSSLPSFVSPFLSPPGFILNTTGVSGVSDSASESASASILRRLVASIVLPTLQILSTAPLEMIMAEQV